MKAILIRAISGVMVIGSTIAYFHPSIVAPNIDSNYSARITPIHTAASFVARPEGGQCAVSIVEVDGKKFAVVMSGNSVGICEVR